MQKKDLIAYSELILGIPDYEVFEDAGYSGKNTVRPAYQDMMTRVRKKEFSHVLVWKIDRISRNLLDFASMYREMKQLGVVFVSKNEQFDTSTAMGEAMLKIILVFAELERSITSERVTATMISRASQGLWNGGRIPFGYSYDAEKQEFSVREDEAVVCRLLRDDYLQHHSLVHTAKLLNKRGYRTRAGALWSPAAVWIIAQSPFYIGSYRYNRYKGTENRVTNPPEEWVTIENHHPAIFTADEHLQMTKIRGDNARSFNAVGKEKTTNMVYVFGGLCICGKCGARMSSAPARLHADGYRSANILCPTRRKDESCDNATVSDLRVGEFVINYILNIINAKKVFSELDTPASLEARLLRGTTFWGIEHIDDDGLNDLFNLFSRYPSDASFALTRKPRARALVNPAVSKLRREKERLERAFKRLQDLYLYSEDAMPEKDFIIRRAEIVSRLSEVSGKLGLFADEAHPTLSDEEFIRQASHLLVIGELQGKEYIFYRTLASIVSPEILREFVRSVVDSIVLVDGRVVRLCFKNGMTHSFIWQDKNKKAE